MAEKISFYNKTSLNPHQYQAIINSKRKLSKPHKIISSLIIEEEGQKVIVALDIENYLHLWFLKDEVIEAVSILDQNENEERKNLVPDLCYNFSAFITDYFYFSKERIIFISNLNYLGNSKRKFIKITGNFDSLVIESKSFFAYNKREFENNFSDLNYYKGILNDSLNINLDGEEKVLKSN